MAIAGGGIVGGLLLDASGAGALPWAALGLALAALLLAATARAHGFPAERATPGVSEGRRHPAGRLRPAYVRRRAAVKA